MYILGVGKRKTSVAKVFMKNGNGNITVNNRKLEEYFDRDIHINTAKQPLNIVNKAQDYDLKISVNGGGLTGQAGAISLAVARALIKAEPELRKELKSNGLLTRDSRVVERKKYGQPKARKRFQFSKR